MTIPSMQMKSEIEKKVAQLVRCAIWGWGRASDLASFQFGLKREVKDFRGRTKTVGEYALHVQCAWRITRGEEIAVGHRDLYYPPSGDNPDKDFDWGPAGTNRRDQLLDEIFHSDVLTVLSVEVGTGGYLCVRISGDLCLEIFPNDSLAHEHWRLFRPYISEPHLVVTGKGIELVHADVF